MPSHSKKPVEKQITRYTFDDVSEPATPETGQTALLPDSEQTVVIPMDNGWADAIHLGKLPNSSDPVILDMDPVADPVLFWAGKRNRREIPILPLQRNEIVTESRIRNIVERSRRTAEHRAASDRQQAMFAGLEKHLRDVDREKRVEFYTHDESWKNKLICGDSLHIMESLLHYERFAGKVQMIYMDPPYGIDYDSNFQQRIDSKKNTDLDKADDVLTIKAFRDTWSLGVHSYLTYLQERLYLCRELLHASGSIFVQINEENLTSVAKIMDEIFGKANFCRLISFTKTTSQTSQILGSVCDYLLWYAKDKPSLKYRPLLQKKKFGGLGSVEYRTVELADGSVRAITDEELSDPSLLPTDARVFTTGDITSEGRLKEGSPDIHLPNGIVLQCPAHLHWKISPDAILNLYYKNRLVPRKGLRIYKRYWDDFPFVTYNNIWSDVRGETSKSYAVQTSNIVVARCVLMTTDPGDLVFDPTCGAGTTAISAERWGRRWVTCDTSRVAVNIARKNLLSLVFDHYAINGAHPGSGFAYAQASRVTMSSLGYDLEPETVPLVDKPETDRTAVRVTGPFEVMTVGRYSMEDWKGYVQEGAKLENYITTICRLYRSDSSTQGISGLVHAIAESETGKFAISVGPLTGRVTARQVLDASEDAMMLGIREVHLLGWAFEANVGEIKSRLEAGERRQIHLISIRPDTLAEGLKVSDPDILFSPFALPDISVTRDETTDSDLQFIVTLHGVGLFDRKRRTTDYYRADSGYISAWYLDEDYDGDCFVPGQMFFDFAKIPNIKATFKIDVKSDEFLFQLASHPFASGKYRQVAVKVVDVYGNESTLIKPLE